MSGATHTYVGTVRWTGAHDAGTASYTAYSRDHEVVFDGRPVILGSSDPSFRGDPARHSPEELFLASLAQCHMLWFLHLASAAGVVVVAYDDDPTGTMRVESAGAGQFTDVTLRPRVVVASASQGAVADDATLASLHGAAHDHCFIARSVNFPVVHEPAPVRVRDA
ncbi:organic hydroperoxide reductase OsmC/OhrA [Sediminihabitans luteus]|uniref:Organic hydroperoxide reductase OsmC/OhrA n=1 Tax=Sediminihabitans luteus TaxID=1138585 RepID=A0A2M9CR42_9CELL|nr:OsmC family protein [Sediminihabitans luteus]PJJ74311.1 organic hydroperoxide reductase OsmC/OhrA [Sediminihabitans luteus]